MFVHLHNCKTKSSIPEPWKHHYNNSKSIKHEVIYYHPSFKNTASWLAYDYHVTRRCSVIARRFYQNVLDVTLCERYQCRNITHMPDIITWLISGRRLILITWRYMKSYRSYSLRDRSAKKSFTCLLIARILNYWIHHCCKKSKIFPSLFLPKSSYHV